MKTSELQQRPKQLCLFKSKKGKSYILLVNQKY